MNKSGQETNSTKEVNKVDSTESTKAIRKPVVSTSQQEKSISDDDRSPIRQERDALESEDLTHRVEKLSETVRKPVVSNPKSAGSASDDDRSPIRQERDALENKQSEHPTEEVG